MNKVFYLFLIVISSLNLFASEGFHVDMDALPKPVALWKNRTFQVSIRDQNTGALGFLFGTAFLVHTDAEYSYFITARHVAIECGTPGSYRCQVSLNTIYDPDERKLITSAQSVVSDVNEVRTFEPNFWSNNHFSSDMGYFRVNRIDPKITGLVNIGENISVSLKETSSNKPFQRTHFVIGYPGLETRKSYIGLYDYRVLKMRWSKGEYYFWFNNIIKSALYTDVDSLPGNSGGPVIAEDGSIMGILVGGPATMGNEYAAFPAYFSYVVPYDYVKFMIGDILLGRDRTKIVFKAD